MLCADFQKSVGLKQEKEAPGHSVGSGMGLVCPRLGTSLVPSAYTHWSRVCNYTRVINYLINYSGLRFLFRQMRMKTVLDSGRSYRAPRVIHKMLSPLVKLHPNTLINFSS